MAELCDTCLQSSGYYWVYVTPSSIVSLSLFEVTGSWSNLKCFLRKTHLVDVFMRLRSGDEFYLWTSGNYDSRSSEMWSNDIGGARCEGWIVINHSSTRFCLRPSVNTFSDYNYLAIAIYMAKSIISAHKIRVDELPTVSTQQTYTIRNCEMSR